MTPANNEYDSGSLKRSKTHFSSLISHHEDHKIKSPLATRRGGKESLSVLGDWIEIFV